MEASDEALRPVAGPSAAGDADAHAATSSFTAVFLHLLLRIASFLPRNEVACVLRLLCKAAAAALRGPQHATVHLSEPSPHAEFKWRWCGPQSLHSTTLDQRQQLEELTARSGVVANLEALAARGGTPLLSQGCWEMRVLLDAAAAAGRLEACRWLHEQRGVQLSHFSLFVAAEGGHLHVCEWLLDRGFEWALGAVRAALERGHVQLAERLLQLRPSATPLKDDDARALIVGAARGCDLATLQRLQAEHIAGRGLDLAVDTSFLNLSKYCIPAAACSPTPDWAAKVEWLKGLGCPRDTMLICKDAAGCADGAARLAWLNEHGYTLHADAAAISAAPAGNAAALRYVLAQGVQLAPQRLTDAWREAYASGSLETVQVLWDAGVRPDDWALEAAARCGHLHIVSWAVEQLGNGAQRSARLFAAAARSGSLPLLRWLHERGCPWDADTWAGAALSGCEEALEWLAERGCPMGEQGKAYVKAARRRDLPTLRCLVRLGCPFAHDGSTFRNAAFKCVHEATDNDEDFDPRPLQFLLHAGCPVDWPALAEEVHAVATDEPDVNTAALKEWLGQQRPQWEAAGGGAGTGGGGGPVAG